LSKTHQGGGGNGVTEGFSGGELEQLVAAAMFLAFSEERDLTTEDLTKKATATVPLSTTMAEGLLRLRHWCEGRAVPAL
jgi:SpoVK/Ycf46/Vps4 family AAA+-type ATPase